MRTDRYVLYNMSRKYRQDVARAKAQLALAESNLLAVEVVRNVIGEEDSTAKVVFGKRRLRDQERVRCIVAHRLEKMGWGPSQIAEFLDRSHSTIIHHLQNKCNCQKGD